MSEETSVLVDLYNTLDRQPASVYVYERLLDIWSEMGVDGKCNFTPNLLTDIDQLV